MKLRHVIYSALASCCIYILLFTFVIHKPMTIGIYGDYYAKKLDYLDKADGRKLIILAGSNGRFSHRCETLEEELGIPCINMSISANLSLDYQFDKIKSYLKAGDIVYLPLEYGTLKGSKRDMTSGVELPYILAYDHSYLKNLDYERLVHAAFSFDLRFLLSGMGEMLLDKLGVKRRFSVDTMNKQGDESTHTSEKARDYMEYITKLQWDAPTVAAIDADSYKAGIAAGFMQWANKHQVVVIGGLPTTFDDSEVPDDLIARFGQFYSSNSHQFIAMPNKSQYPRSMFYDTEYHLTEKNQIAHTRMLAAYLRELIGN